MKMFKLLGPDGKIYESKDAGKLGGYNGRVKIYGSLDCPSAKKWINKGFYVKQRVFFKDEKDAVKAGFRPCAICQKEKYLLYKTNPKDFINLVLNNEENNKEK